MRNNVSATISLKAIMDTNMVRGGISKIQESLNKLKLPANLTHGLETSQNKLINALTKLESNDNQERTVGNLNTLYKDIEKVQKAWVEFTTQLGKIPNLDINKIGLANISSEFKKIAEAQREYENSIKQVTQSQVYKDKTAAEAKVDNLETATKALKEYQAQLEIVNKAQKKLDDFQAKGITERSLNKEQNKHLFDEAWSGFKSKYNTRKGNKNNFNWDELEEVLKAAENLRGKESQKNFSDYLQNTFNIDTGKLAEARNELQQLLQLKKELDASKKITSDESKEFQDAKQLKASAELAAKAAATEFSKVTKGLNFDIKNPVIGTELAKQLNEAKAAAENLQTEVDKLFQTKGSTASWDKINQALTILSGKTVKLAEGDFEALQREIDQINAKNLEKVEHTIADISANTNEASTQMRSMVEKMGGIKDESDNIKHANQEMEQLKGQIQYFFGINNAVNLFQRAIRDAYDTVKELDAAMTETAVVTDFSVGDMWDQLPRYTEEANKLGATTLGAYETMTLYYQQGLESNEAFALGTETMKMARIANMEYADATEMMTAAIRGFNMALNETSAQRVNDVYSELAAITAANTEQIATAMTKTASIADSANMEFETTAALLSQIIETTQEAPETAGTAMKTIIARFTEVKQLFTQGQLTGKDSEGEVININKIDAALKSVGMSLQGFLRGEQGIDDIFLELASKWDTLDLSTQRYIATMAAGSRQQSRFIAMMSNYERTMELVSAANNSAGASQRQFDKTLDSLEAKLNKLKNAWDQFTMGLANNSLIKAGVDTLTTILTLANNLTKIFGGSLLGSIVKVGLAIKGLSLGKMGVTGLGSLMGKAVKTKQGAAVYKALGLETLLGKITGGDKESGGITTGQKIVSSGSTFAGIITNAANTFRSIITGAAVQEKVANAPQQLKGLGESIRFALFGNAAKHIKAAEITEDWNNYDINNDNRAKWLDKYVDEDTGLLPELNEVLDSELNLETLKESLTSGFLGDLGNKLAEKGLFQQGRLNKFVTTGLLGKVTGLLSGAMGGASGAAAALTGLATTLTAVGVAGWAAYKGIKALYDASPEGQLKQAEKLADTIGEVADKASQQANEIRGLYDAYQTNQQAIKDASNLDEYREAINASNEQIMQMMESHPDLITGDMIEFQDGQITLISDKFENAVNQFEAAANNLRFDDTYAQANELYKRADVYDSEFWKIEMGIAEVGGEGVFSPEELAELRRQQREYQTLSQSTRTQADTVAASAYYNLIGDAVKEAGYGDVLASAVAKAWGANEEAQIKFRRSKMDEGTIPKEFERITGLASDGYTKEYMKDTIAMAQFREAQDSSLQEIENLFLNNQESVGTLLKFLDGTYKGELAEEFSDLGDFATTFNLELKDADLTKLIELLGFSTEEGAENNVFDYFNEQNQEYERIRSALRQELYTSLFSYADKTSSSINLDAIQNLDVESQERMKSFMDAIQHFSDEGKGAAWSFMPEIVRDADKFASVIDSIDFQNPIAMARDLQKILQDSDHIAYGFAEALWNSESQFLSLQSQLKYLMSSEGYAGVIEQVEELIDVNGELTGDDIEELADDCQELRDMLDESTLSAEALAKALTQIELGELNVDQLTDDVLQALSSVQELDQFFRNGESMRENFDEGRDYAEGYEWLSGLFEELQENVNNYEFGNERTVNLAKALFGEDAFESIDTAYNRQNPEAYFAAYQGQIARFSDLMENNGEGFAKALVDARILTTDGKKYEFNQELTGNMSTVVDEIAKALNIGTEGAQMLWENYLAHDRDLTVKYQEGLVAEATEAFKDSKITDNELYATADEIDAMAKALAMTPQQIEDFKASLKEAGIAVVDWSNQTGKDILGSLDSIFGNNTRKNLEDSLISEDGINYHQAISELSKYGIFGEQADSVITEMAQITGEAITATVKFWDGEQITEKQLEMGKDEEGNPIEETLQSFLARVAETQSREIQEAAIDAATDENWSTTNDLLSQILNALVLLNPDSKESKAAEASEEYLNAAESAAGDAKAATSAEEATLAAQGAAEAAAEVVRIAGEAKKQGLLNADDLAQQAVEAVKHAIRAGYEATQKYGETDVTSTKPISISGSVPTLEEMVTLLDTSVGMVEQIIGQPIKNAIQNSELLDRVINEGDFTGINPSEETLSPRSQEQDKTSASSNFWSDIVSFFESGIDPGYEQEAVFETNKSNEYLRELPSNSTFLELEEINENTANSNLIFKEQAEALDNVGTEIANLSKTYNDTTEAGEANNNTDAFLGDIEAAIIKGFGSVQNFDNLQTVNALQTNAGIDFTVDESQIKQQIKDSVDLEALKLKGEIDFESMSVEEIISKITDATKSGIEDGTLTGVPLLTSGIEEGVASTAPIIGNYLSTAIGTGGQTGAARAQAAINSIYARPLYSTLTYYVKYIGGKVPGRAAGGIVPSYASGSANRKIEAGMALTGEEDPEIVWNKEQGYAYIAGENGPEFNHLQPGDRVFNAQETKEIFRRSGRSAAKGGIISAAAGWGAPESEGSSGGGGRSSGSGSKENKPSEWKNEFDWLYNLVEDIVELERERNKIVERYQDLLEDNNATAQDLVNSTIDELKNLYSQQARQQSVYEKRQQEMNDYLAHYSQYAAYGGYNFEDQTVEINWDAIEAIQDEEYYGDVKEYVEGLEEIQDKMDEADDALLDINNEIQEIEERFLEAYTNFENRVLDAIVNLRQKEIDELSNINSTIKDTNSRLFDAVQKSLSLQRQDRENAKTEEEIAKKERRLAFLRQDTSTDNTISIRELEKELDELKEDYTDELIDQKLDFLQDQEDFAAEQRERQIELMESQLAFEQETGQLWAQVEDLIMNAMGPDGKLLEGSELVSILQSGETWESLSAAQQKVWQDTLIGEFNEALAYLLFEKTDLSVIKETTFNEAMKDIIAELQNVSKSIANIKFTYSDSGGGSGGSGSGGAVGGGQPITQPTTCSGNCTGICMSGCTGSCSTGCYGDCKYSCSVGCKVSCYTACSEGCTTSCNTTCKGYCQGACKGSANQYNGGRQSFATGGYTGDWSGNEGKLAVLHKKELILNAKDTANFIELKEVLASGTLDALSAINPANTSNISGDTYIDITVEAELKNDYDVEQLTKKIKSEIYKDGSYRGVNVIHKIR